MTITLGADSLAQFGELVEALLSSGGELLHVLRSALGELQYHGFGCHILGGHVRHFAGDGVRNCRDAVGVPMQQIARVDGDSSHADRNLD